MSATERREYPHAPNLSNALPFGTLPTQEQQFKPQSGYGTINQDLLLQLAAGNMGRPAMPNLQSNAGPPSNYGLVLNLLEQALKRPNAIPPAAVQQQVKSRPSSATNLDKFWVVREICRSANGKELKVSVESGPCNDLTDAYGILQLVKRTGKGELDPANIISLQEHVTVWIEPGMDGLFLIQMTEEERGKLSHNFARQSAPPIKPEQVSLPLEANNTMSGARFNKSRSLLRPRSSKGNCTLASPQGGKRVPAIGGHSSAFRPVSKQMSGSATDKSVSTASLEHSEGHKDASPTSSHRNANRNPEFADLRKLVKPEVKGQQTPTASLQEAEAQRINNRSPTTDSSKGKAAEKQAAPAQLHALADAATHAESPEPSDYSVNRSYRQAEEPAVAARLQPVEDADLQEDELMKDVVQSMMALAKQGPSKPDGTPPSSDGTRAYLTSSDDEFNVLKNAPKRRRSVYLVKEESAKAIKVAGGPSKGSQGSGGAASRKPQKMAVISCSADAGWIPKA